MAIVKQHQNKLAHQDHQIILVLWTSQRPQKQVVTLSIMEDPIMTWKKGVQSSVPPPVLMENALKSALFAKMVFVKHQQNKSVQEDLWTILGSI
jgi:hypothetical protein